jgi:hypothetical protein
MGRDITRWPDAFLSYSSLDIDPVRLHVDNVAMEGGISLLNFGLTQKRDFQR